MWLRKSRVTDGTVSEGQPEGLPESSRWSSDHRNAEGKNHRHPERVREEKRFLALLLSADSRRLDTGGLRLAPTSGYFRATLRVANHGRPFDVIVVIQV